MPTTEDHYCDGCLVNQCNMHCPGLDVKKPAEATPTPPVSPSNSSDLLCGQLRPKCKYYEFYDSVSCLFAEGVEFMTRDEIYAAIKKDWAKMAT